MYLVICLFIYLFIFYLFIYYFGLFSCIVLFCCCFVNLLSFCSSQHYCVGFGADLVKIESERENNFIRAELHKLGKRSFLLKGSARA